MFAQRKKIFLLFALLILIIVLIFIVISFKQISTYLNNPSQKITTKIERLYFDEASFPKSATEKYLKILKDRKSTKEEKYEALNGIYIEVSTAYDVTESPIFREFSEELDNYASSKFPELHNPGNFLISCSDITCREKVNPEIKNISNQVEKLEVHELTKRQILEFLNNHSVDSPEEDRTTQYIFAYNLLVSLGDENASKAAVNLKDYLFKAYKITL